jgi:IS4 transposase
MDRGYNDYALFGKWSTEEIYFVTRLKDNAAYEVTEERAVPENRSIRSDQLIQLTGEKAQKDCPCPLRRVAVWDAVNQREIVLLTNLLAFGATTIAAIYKDRWEIELFFKALKQNLKVKSFVGTSENALRIQILDSLDRRPAAQMAAPSFQSQVVAVQSGFHAAFEPVHLSRLDRLVG